MVVETPTMVTNSFGELYEDKGRAQKEISSNETLNVSVKVFRKRVNLRSQKSFRNYDNTLYGYSIVCESSSKVNNNLTSTWLFGFWVRVNDVPITQPIYPRGKDIMIYTKPTVAHYFETEEEEIKINIGWVESVPDPKIIK